MCNTRSKVYLQSMKTYILSVNTLTWKLTSERHDNCAPCLGLILPIRWVMPPPDVLFWSVSLMASWLHSLRIWFVFNIDLTSHLSSQCWVGLMLIYTYIRVLSSTTFTYSYVFMIIFTMLTWLSSDIYILVFCPLQHSLIATSSLLNLLN